MWQGQAEFWLGQENFLAWKCLLEGLVLNPLGSHIDSTSSNAGLRHGRLQHPAKCSVVSKHVVLASLSPELRLCAVRSFDLLPDCYLSGDTPGLFSFPPVIIRGLLFRGICALLWYM